MIVRFLFAFIGFFCLTISTGFGASLEEQNDDKVALANTAEQIAAVFNGRVAPAGISAMTNERCMLGQ